MKKLWWVPSLLMLAGAMVAGWFIISSTNSKPQYQIVSCDSTPSDFKCWQKRYEGFVMLQSPKEAFADAKIQYEANDYFRSQCHQISHVIGQTAAKKYNDLAEAYKYGDNFCWSGYYHGVVEGIAAKLGADGFISDLENICQSARDQERYSFYHYNCVHGLGHGLMAITNNQLFVSLKDCQALTDPWEQESCYGGVFMENVMSSINPDHHTDYIKADDPMYPCTAVDQQFKQQCYLMQTSHALQVVNYNYQTVFGLCSQVAAPLDATCYQSLGRDASGNSVSNVDKTREVCLLGTTYAARENCVIGAVKDFISYYHSDQQGLALCASFNDTNLRATCQQTAQEYYKTF